MYFVPKYRSKELQPKRSSRVGSRSLVSEVRIEERRWIIPGRYPRSMFTGSNAGESPTAQSPLVSSGSCNEVPANDGYSIVNARNNHHVGRRSLLAVSAVYESTSISVLYCTRKIRAALGRGYGTFHRTIEAEGSGMGALRWMWGLGVGVPNPAAAGTSTSIRGRHPVPEPVPVHGDREEAYWTSHTCARTPFAGYHDYR